MKKIYILTAVFALLTLSLNAQMEANPKVAQKAASTEKKVGTPLDGSKIYPLLASRHAPARAQSTTVTFVPEYSSSTVRTKTVDGVTLTISAGDLGYSNEMRLNGTVTLSTTEGTITQIVFNGSTTTYPVTRLSTSTGNYTTGNNVGTWVGNSESVNFSASSQVYVSSIVVTLETVETSQLTVCDGNYWADMLPVFGYYHDVNQHNQMVYPASMLSAMTGKKLKSMTFYPTSGFVDDDEDGVYDTGETTYSGLNFYGGSVTFKLMNLSSGTSGYADENATLITGTMTQVSTIVPQRNTSATTWVITFDQEFTYTGGDLLIDITTVAGTYSHTAFTVDEVNPNLGVLTMTYNGTAYALGLDYLPKVTFTYEIEGDPELIAPEDGSTVDVGTHEGASVSTTIPVSGHNLTGDLTVSVSGTGFSVSPTTISAADANAGTSVTVTYNGTDENATGTLTITSSNGEVETVNVNLTASYVEPVPELLAPTDGSTVNVGTNPGAGVSTTITVNGYYLTGDLTISVEGTGFSVEPTTISAADANAGTTITVTYNGYSAAGTGTLTITSSNGEVEPVTVNLTGNFVPQPIEPVTGLLRLHLLLVDQLKANIPDDNSHADSYRYVLKYEPAGEEAKESSPVKVDIHKTECEVKGYYTKAEIDGDTDGTLEMDVLTADVEFNLTDDDNTIDFYNLQGLANEYPALGEDYLTKLQQTTGFIYYEMLEGSPNKGDDYPAGLHHYYDDSTPILTGTYTNGFMSYAPSLSTFGVERRYYEDDGLDNTYGAPIWRTRVGKVEIQGKPAMQKQVINAGTSQEANNPHTTWTVGNKTYCLYFLGVNAQGTLPRPYATDYPQGTNIKYEPYMFRVFVSSPTGKLRKFDRVLNPNGGGYEAVDVGPIGPNEKYCVGSFYKNEGWHADDLFFSKTISAQNTTNGFADDGGNDFDPYAWDGIMKFGAEDGISASDVKVWVRMYYMVEGWDATRDGEARPGNGSEGSGDPDDPSTFIYEFDYNAEVVGVTYVNAQGMTSDKPFDGMNIVVTRYSDGTTSTVKVFK